MSRTILPTIAALIVAPGVAAADGRPAPAAALAPPPAPADARPSEYGLGTLEVLGAAGTAVAWIAIDLLATGGDPLEFDRGGKDTVAAALLLGVPALQGLAVCGIGKLSRHYDGRCAWPILGAYTGVAPFVPLAFLVASQQDDPLGAGLMGAATLGLGLLVAAPLAATWTWNHKKFPRGARVYRARLPRPILDPPSRRAAPGGTTAALILPVAAFSF